MFKSPIRKKYDGHLVSTFKQTESYMRVNLNLYINYAVLCHIIDLHV